MSSSAVFKAAKKSLIDPAERDRAGATAINVVQNIEQQLKDIHKNTFTSTAIGWTIWANYISASEAHLQETRLNDPPPPHIIHLFDRVQTSAEALLTNARRNTSIGLTLNEGFAQGLKVVQKEIDELAEVVGNVQIRLSALRNRVHQLVNESESNNRVLSVFENSLEPRETEFSSEMFGLIADQEDVDHV